MITVGSGRISGVLITNSRGLLKSSRRNRACYGDPLWCIKKATTRPLFTDGASTIFLNVSNNHAYRKAQTRASPCVCSFSKWKVEYNNGMFTGKTLFNANQPITSGSGTSRHYSSLPPIHEKFIINPAYNDSYIKIISESPPVQCMQDLILYVHDTTGLPWWATIVLSTVLLRTVTLPIVLYQHYNTAKVWKVSTQMEDVVDKLKKDANYARIALNQHPRIVKKNFQLAVRKEWNDRIVANNCHPAKGIILILSQISVLVCVSFALRNMCFMLPYPTEFTYQIFQDLTAGGFGWLSNLTRPDKLYILPVAVGIIHLAIVEVQRITNTHPLPRYARYLRYIHIAMVPLSMFITSCMPGAIALYWFTSSSFNIFQQLLLLSPKVRRFVRIPETKFESQDPYEPLRNAIKKKFTVKSAAAEPAVKSKRKHMFYDEINYTPLY